MRKILRSLGKVLARVFLRLRAGVGWCAGFGDGLVAGLFGGGGYDVEEDEVVEVANDEPVDAAIEREPACPSLALLVRRACACRDAGRPYDVLFDDQDEEHRRAKAFVAALDEGGLRAVRHMPVGTLARHLDRADPFKATGLPDVDIVITNAEKPPVEVPAAKRERVRSATAKLIEEAQKRGEPLDLASVLAARRAA